LYIANSSVIEDYTLAKLARQLDWQVYEAPELNKRGIPILKHMYMDAAQRVPNCGYYTYSNGDILYSHDIIETLEETSKVTAVPGLCSTHCSQILGCLDYFGEAYTRVADIIIANHRNL